MSKITRLQADNFKKLSVIDIRPGAGVVPIRGRNAQGKSSTLDAIQAALGGKRVMPSRPVRAGEDEGAIRLELDNGSVILRRFTADGRDTIEVTNGEGFKAGSPQKMLDGLYASVAFDPLAFTRLEPAKQLARLRELVTLDIDVDAEERAIAADYEKRRDQNREVEREAGRLRDMSLFADAPAEPVDEAALEATIAGAVEVNSDIERRKQAREQAAIKVDEHLATSERWTAEAARLRDEAARADEHAFKAAGDAQALQERLDAADPLPEPVDVTQAQAGLRIARQANAKIDANRQHAAQEKLVERLKTESAGLTTAIDSRRAAIAASIARAAMPVPGLAFGDGEVLLNGLPLDQASSAEQLRVSTAIGMATSPKLRVMLVRDGSLLDDDGERILAELAEANDFQLWVEAVDTSGKVGIVLEDGAVVSIDGEPAPEPEAIEKVKRRAKKPEITASGPETINVEASLDSGRDETFSAEPITDDQDGDVQPEADTLPWEDEADRRYDQRRADEDMAADEQATRVPAQSLFD